MGAASDMISATTAGSPPRAAGREGILLVNKTWASLSLHGWDDGGCVITHFTVHYRRSDHTNWISGKLFFCYRK